MTFPFSAASTSPANSFWLANGVMKSSSCLALSTWATDGCVNAKAFTQDAHIGSLDLFIDQTCPLNNFPSPIPTLRVIVLPRFVLTHISKLERGQHPS